MGNSQSGEDEKKIQANNDPDSSNRGENAAEEDDDLLTDPIQRLFFLLKKSVVEVEEIKELLNREGEGKIDLKVADIAPVLPENADLKDPLVQRIQERINKKTYLGDYALHMLVGRPAIQNTPEVLELVKLFFLKDHPMNCRNKLGSTPLHRACAAGNAAMAKELIAWGAQVDAVNDLQHTCLHFACYAGHADVVQLLLDNGCAKHIQFKCAYGVAPCDYVLKDDVRQILKAAHRGTKGGAAPAKTAPVPEVAPQQEKIIEEEETEAEEAN